MNSKDKTALIKELRERTGSGFLDVRQALEACDYKIEAAIDFLKEKGKVKAAKKAGRIAAEGLVRVAKNEHKAIIFELNSETDFVAQNQQFLTLLNQIETLLLNNAFTNLEEALMIKNAEAKTIEELVVAATATIGEKLSLRRVQAFPLNDKIVAGIYNHTNGKVAALLVVKGEAVQEARNVAMHISAMNPEFLSQEQIPEKRLEKIKAQIHEKVLNELNENVKLKNKPEEIKNKIAKSMISGKLNKELSEFTLLNQEFVMDNNFNVAQYLSHKGLTALVMARYEVGEGISKEATDFAAEVAQQMKK